MRRLNALPGWGPVTLAGFLAHFPVKKNRAHADGPEEGSIAPLIVGMLALLLLIGSVTVAITGAYLQTQHLQDLADAQANSVTHQMNAAGERNDAAARTHASSYLSSVQMGRDLQGLQIRSVYVDSSRSVHVELTARIHPPLISVIVPDGIEVSAHGSSRLKDGQGPSAG